MKRCQFFRKQPFADTTNVLRTLKEMQRFSNNDWEGFEGDAQTFFNVQKQIRPEIEYLKSLHVNGTFCKWFCLPAYYDTPEPNRNYTASKNIVDKQAILTDRRYYLHDLQKWLYNLYRSWNFTQQSKLNS